MHCVFVASTNEKLRTQRLKCQVLDPDVVFTPSDFVELCPVFQIKESDHGSFVRRRCHHPRVMTQCQLCDVAIVCVDTESLLLLAAIVNQNLDFSGLCAQCRYDRLAFPLSDCRKNAVFVGTCVDVGKFVVQSLHLIRAHLVQTTCHKTTHARGAVKVN